MEIRTSIRLSDREAKAIKESAEHDRRPWTAQIVALAMEALRKRGVA